MANLINITMEMEIPFLTETTAQHFMTHLSVSVALWLLVIAVIMLDLWDGVYTAKVTHQRIHSHKLRVTIDKVSEYWRLMLVGFFIDTIGVLFPVYALPYLSILFCVGLIGVEAKSMLEHAKRRKSKALEAKEIISMVIDCATEVDAHAILEKINEYMNNDKSKKSE